MRLHDMIVTVSGVTRIGRPQSEQEFEGKKCVVITYKFDHDNDVMFLVRPLDGENKGRMIVVTHRQVTIAPESIEAWEKMWVDRDKPIEY